MRLIAGFLCFFLLILTGGTISYIYIMWTNYWLRVTAIESGHMLRQVQRVDGDTKRNVLHRHQRNRAGEEEVKDNGSRPRARQSYDLNQVTRADSAALASLPQDKLLAHLRVYRDQIIAQLRSTVRDTGKQVGTANFPNAYNVSYKGPMRNKKEVQNSRSPRELLCDAAKHVKLETFRRGNEMFEKLQLDRFFPKKNFLESRRFNTCAVVSSAGSLKDSGLGAYIDSHDIVIRFNNAPTDQHDKDVGNKTSIRIVNSQVVAKPQYKFIESPLYSQSAVLVWDPSGYNASLHSWYNRPDWPFFEQFFSKRLMAPEDSLFLLQPSSLWGAWNWLQSVTAWPLLPTPPSSGFLGLLLTLQHCSVSHVFEYIPSMRLTKRCHYYDAQENLGCTLGDWHPLSAEKLLAMGLHTGTDIEMLREGYITIPGFSTCATDDL